MHFLQSPAWRDYQNSLGHKTFEISGNGWRAMLFSEISHSVGRLYAPYGPEADSLPALGQALATIERLGKDLGQTFVRVEPTGVECVSFLKELGYLPAPEIQPADTWCIDLTVDEATLLKQMGSTNRNHYRGYQRRGMEIVESVDAKDIQYLSAILREVSDRNDFNAQSQDYLTKQARSLFASGAARLFLVKFQDQVIAASLAYQADGVRYYAHSGSDQEHKKLRAGNALVAYMLMDAKEQGFRQFDLYGIAPGDDPDHPWAGFTKFKKSFGGYPRHYVGTWEKPLKPLKYAIYETVRHLTEWTP